MSVGNPFTVLYRILGKRSGTCAFRETFSRNCAQGAPNYPFGSRSVNDFEVHFIKLQVDELPFVRPFTERAKNCPKTPVWCAFREKRSRF